MTSHPAPRGDERPNSTATPVTWSHLEEHLAHRLNHETLVTAPLPQVDPAPDLAFRIAEPG